jgi:hypothetical protein
MARIEIFVNIVGLQYGPPRFARDYSGRGLKPLCQK